MNNQVNTAAPLQLRASHGKDVYKNIEIIGCYGDSVLSKWVLEICLPHLNTWCAW